MEHDTETPEPQPPRLNGPAFLVFGIMFVVIGLGVDLNALVVVGILLVLLGAVGIVALRRYEKAAGIEDELPGGRPKGS